MRPVEKKKPGDTVEFKTSMNEGGKTYSQETV